MWPDVLVPALLGALGALVARVLLKMASSIRPLATYYCSDIGSDKDRGKPWHSFGERVRDEEAEHGVAWAHTPEQIGTKVHTLFGPYMNDVGRPGYIRVVFRISGAGLSDSDEPAIILDVVQVPFDLQPAQVILKEKTIKSRELKTRYRKFRVDCYSSGVGAHEYRAQVVGKAFDTNLQVRFDTIRVYKHFPLSEIV